MSLAPRAAAVLGAVNGDGLGANQHAIAVGGDRARVDVDEAGRFPGDAEVVGTQHAGAVGARVDPLPGAGEAADVALPDWFGALGPEDADAGARCGEEVHQTVDAVSAL